jgi:hypothetical protein
VLKKGENDTVKTGKRNVLNRGKEMRHKGHSERNPLFQNVVPSVLFSIRETKRNHRGLSAVSREDGER